jgi:hypothetical protein
MSRPIRQLQKEITSREFVMWSVFLEREDSKTTKQDFYLAQIAAEVVRNRDGVDASRVTLDSKILKFETRAVAEAPPLTEEQKLSYAKASWFAQTGYVPKEGEL